MTKAEEIKIIEEYIADREKKSVSSWAASFNKATKKGILDETKPQGNATREQMQPCLTVLIS